MDIIIFLVPFQCNQTQFNLRGGGGGVQAYKFGNFNYEIRVEGEGQDTSRLFKGGFGTMRTILPMRSLGAKIGPNTKILTKRDKALIWTPFDSSRKNKQFKIKKVKIG